MSKYVVDVQGHRNTYRGYSATVEVEASSVEEAITRAKDVARMYTVDWNERSEDHSNDEEIQVDSAEVTEEPDEA
jgi:hypothetical protein